MRQYAIHAQELAKFCADTYKQDPSLQLFRMNYMGILYVFSIHGLKTQRWNCLPLEKSGVHDTIVLNNVYKIMAVQHGNLLVQRSCLKLKVGDAVTIQGLTNEKTNDRGVPYSSFFEI